MKLYLKKLLTLIALICIGGLGQSCSLEDLPVYRVRVRIDTSSKTNAATDDLLHVKLTDSSEKFYLDYGRNDFEQGNSHYYDVTFSNIYKLEHITKLQIIKSGSNGVCLERVRLYINDNIKMFDQNYGNDNCKWLDNSNGHTNSVTFSNSTLRDDSNWQIELTDLKYPEEFSAGALENIIEGIVGNELHKNDSGVRWGYKSGSEYVSVTKINSSSQNVNLDLKFETSYENWRGKTKEVGISIDVDFDLIWKCENNEFIMETKNLDVDVSLEDGPLWLKIADFFVSDALVDDFVDSQVANMDLMKGINQSLGECPNSFSVNSSGDLEMDWPEIDLSDL